MNLALLDNTIDKASSRQFREEFDKMSDDQKFAYYQMGIVNSVTLDILVCHIMGLSSVDDIIIKNSYK